MKVGVIGSGDVGKSLANGFVRHGHEVMMGTRSPEKLDAWKESAGPSGNVGSFSDAAAFGEVVVLAVAGTAAADALKLAGADNLGGKTVVDTTNPISSSPPENGVLKYFTTLDKSLMEHLQAAYPDAHFVKAFSCVGYALMVNPDLEGVRPSMFICGDNEDAKSQVRDILDQFGYDTEDMGGVEAARAIEPLAILWCIPGFLRKEWNHVYKVLRA